MTHPWFAAGRACLVAATFGFVAAAFVAANAQSALGGAYITTLPSGAEVWFDGTYVGRSPLVIDGVAPGRHGMTITKTGWSTVESAVVVSAGMLATSSTRLGPGAHGTGPAEDGALVIRGLPARATVSVDGATSAATKDPLMLSAGPHQLVVLTPHSRQTRGFTIYPGTTTDVMLGAAPSLERRSAVVAPAEDYLPTNAFVVEGNKIVVRYLGHVVVAHFGDTHVLVDGSTIAFNEAPESIGGKLYLPLELLEKVTGDVSKSR